MILVMKDWELKELERKLVKDEIELICQWLKKDYPHCCHGFAGEIRLNAAKVEDPRCPRCTIARELFEEKHRSQKK